MDTKIKKEDARKISPDAQHERRKQIIRLHLKGFKPSEISENTGVSDMSARRVIKTFNVGGWVALAPQKRGRSEGEKRLLTQEQEAKIQKIICDKRPEQLRLRFALWTRAAVGKVIAQECKIHLPVRTIGEYLRRWGFTPQKPILRAYERCPIAVKKWLEVDYPELAKRAVVEGAEIHWGDESALCNTDVRGRGFAPKGKTPVALHPGKREHLTMISSVSNRGKMSWMIIDGSYDSERMIEFLGRLLKDCDKKVFLILDNLRVHHSKVAKAWVAERADKIALFYLPAYSPELNPDERLNAEIKQYVGARVPVRTKEKLKSTTSYRLQVLQKDPERIKALFGDEHVRYAA